MDEKDTIGHGQIFGGLAIVIFGIAVGGIGIATAGIGIGIPLIPVGAYLVYRGIHTKRQAKDERRILLEKTRPGKFWLGVLLCIIGIGSAATGVGIVIALVGGYLVFTSLRGKPSSQHSLKGPVDHPPE